MNNFRIRYVPWPPYADEVVSDDNKTYISGIAADVYEGMKTWMGFEYDLKLQPDKTYGLRDATGNWTGMMGSMIQNETDLSGPYMLSEERASVVVFSIPVAFTQMCFVSGLVQKNRDNFLMFRIFSLSVWLMMFLSVAIVSGAACVIYHALPCLEKRRNFLETFSRYFWTFQFCVLGKGFGSNKRWFIRHVGTSPSFRFLQCVWFSTLCLVLMYAYQGKITSVFAADKFKPQIETMDDLLKYTSIEINTYKNCYPHHVMSTLVNTRYESVWFRLKKDLVARPNKGSIPAWMDLVEEGKSAVFGESRFMMELIGDRFLKTGKCGLRITAVDLGSSHVAFAFRKQFYNTTILRKFNKALRRFNEANLAHFRMMQSSFYYDICTGVNDPIVNPLKFTELQGAFILLFTGIGLSFIIFGIELLVKKCK